ncbi:Serine/threonine-protein kinase PknB [Polystyrenella longa]|uniref:Serine/threonine-protein kinase PknB n=1 Tax=Polystyrenella longa TaxID=2528007 RepID=A0A518CMJ3_9PLAN|nr:serine/threonine-protein kinase [Polystyrenella longa]QDU80448.1 Serine/threonine-protein kinase PknB [Polystyrenella longa]
MAPKPSDENAQSKPVPRPANESKPTDTPRKMFSKFEIHKKLGSGGMGSVYLARDTELDRFVALKILPKDKADNPTLLKRFKSEAQAAATLRHDNIVMVYGAGEHEGYYYMVMEYVEGVDVHRLIAKKDQLSVKRSIEIVKQVGSALEHINSKGIVHRDIKPSNLFIQRDGIVKLGDLGLARSLEDSEEAGVTRAGTTVGTVDYISPEQARNSKAADIRSDIYSLGCTWYHMLTGLPPFPDGSLTNKLHAHAVKPPPNPQIVNEAVPDGVVAIMHRMMAKRPEDRYQTPTELIQDLEQSILTKQDIANTVLASLQEEDDFIEAESKTPIPPTTAPQDHSPKTPSPRNQPIQTPLPKAANKQKGSTEAGQTTTTSSEVQPTENPNNSSIRKMTIPSQRIDASTKGPTDDSFRMQVDPLKLVLAGGSTLILLAALIYGVNFLFQTMTTHGNSNQSGVVNEVGPLDNRQKDEQGNPEENPQGSQDGSESKDEKDKTASVTVKSIAQVEVEKRADQLSKEFFPILDASQRLHLQNYSWLNKFLISNAASDLKTLKVQRFSNRATANDAFDSVPLAYKNAPNKGAVIEIAGDQSLTLRPIRLVPSQHIVLRGISSRDGSRPLLMIEPSDVDPLFAVSKGTLEIENLDLVILPPRRMTSSARPLFQLDGGELFLNDSSISSIHPAPNSLIEMVPNAQLANRVVMQDVVVRGDGLTVAEEMSSTDELVSVNSLFINKSVPLFKLASSSEGTSESQISPPAINLQLFSSTCISGKNGLSIPAGLEGVFRVYSFKNLYAALESGNHFIPSGSPITMTKLGVDSSRPGVKMRWFEKGSNYSGWATLLHFADDSRTPVKNAKDWNKLWDLAVTDNQVKFDVWTTANQNRMGPLKELKATNLLGERGDGIGCNISSLEAPEGRLLLERYETRLLTKFAALFPLESEGSTAEEFKIPKESTEFFERLQSDEWADNTHFVLTSSVNNKDTLEIPWKPVSVTGKSLTIEFRPSKSSQKVLFRPETTTGDRALITVERGDLRLLNLGFDARTARNGELPRSVVDVLDGSFLLEHCLVQTTFQDPEEKMEPVLESVIRWRETEAVEKEFRTGRIIDSFLYSFNPPVHSSVEKSRLQILNSCLLSGSSVVRQEIIPEHQNPDNENFWTNSTLSSWNQFFEIVDRRNQSLDSNSIELEMFHLFLGPAYLNNQKTPELVRFNGQSLEKPFLRTTIAYVGRDDSVRTVMAYRNPDENESTVTTEDQTRLLTGYANPFDTLPEAGKLLSLKAPLPEKQERYVSPLSYAIDPNSAGDNVDGTPEFGADLDSLPSYMTGKKGAYSKGSNNKAWNRNSNAGSRGPEF